ncbi:helix-turn-helix domain-containing protein [Spirosoma pollinicola]|uniref:Transcriptional regulator n=1 Tax=Spirosoma pollinicola TaxID=2057025 RepID=A0A2K8Z4U7_9BACT|nr:transcriptional regulator [Spirosoma pollinicola]AUD04849.1 transcriptional regulator [Spirosoma pollinicola]
MIIRPLKNEADYDLALERLNEIFDASANTPEGDEAELLILLIDSYENEHYAIEAPDPIEAIKIRLEEMELKQQDLVGIIGGKSRVSEVLNRKRKLTVDMIRKLTEALHLSAATLIGEYQLVK